MCQEDWTGERTVCLCPEGFSGELCEVSVQPCVTNPCQNNGHCGMTNGRETCTCTIGEYRCAERGTSAVVSGTGSLSGRLHWYEGEMRRSSHQFSLQINYLFCSKVA